jgi:hypothetical protein
MKKISTAQEYIHLIDVGDPEGQDQLRNGIATEEVWLEIIGERPDLARTISHNKNLPLSIIRILATNPDPTIRYFIARKRFLPGDLFEQLSTDQDESVRESVAWNKQTPREVLERLLADESPIVSERARERLGSR